MAGEVDSQAVITTLLPSLHSDSRANLTFWTESDLINWMDEALKRLGRVAGVFVERDTSITTVNGTADYALPQRHHATLHASYGSTALRPASMLELEMRDPDFQTTTGSPDHWYEDGQGFNIALSPVPNAAVNLPLIMTAWPPALDTAKANTLVQAPAPIAPYLFFYALGKAYERESEVEMQDLAQHCLGQCELLEKAFEKYYGAGL
jgi:hypothetical protein